jgi:hypothetical protein
VRVFLACAAYRDVRPLTARSHAKLCLARPPELVDCEIKPGYGAYANLEWLFETAAKRMGPNLDDAYVLYHDSDVVFTEQSFRAIIDLMTALHRHGAPGVHVVGTSYQASWGWTPERKKVLVGHATGPWAAMEGGTEFAPADRIGFGFVLIPLRFLRDNFRFPWFYEKWDGAEVTTPDTVFGDRAQQAGAALWLARIPGVGHHVTSIEEECHG